MRQHRRQTVPAPRRGPCPRGQSDRGERSIGRLTKTAGWIALAVALAVAPASAQPAPEARVVVDGLDFPAGLAFESDGTMYVSERPGRLRVVEGGSLRPQPLATVDVTTSGETGLLDLAVSPDERFVYGFATYPGGSANRVFRVPIQGGEPEVVVDDLPGSTYHNGGGVAFDADGMLLISNGETHQSNRAQEPAQLGGKIYRFTPDGDVPADNPFGDSPTFALGLRNPFGLTVDPATGTPWVTENGPDSHDEVNRIVEEGNYGWPEFSGPAGSGADTGRLPGDYHDPAIDFPEIIVPTGLAFADPDTARPDVAGDLFFGAFGGGTIYRARLNEDRDEVASHEVWLDAGAPVIAVEWGPEGLYFTTPQAVMVVPIAAEEPEETATPTSQETATPQETETPAAAAAEDDEGIPWWVYLGAAAIVASVGAALWWRRSRAARTR